MIRKAFLLTLGIHLAFAVGAAAQQTPAAPQAQQDTLADAARKAREQKQPTKPAKVFTNDDLAGLKGNISVVGPEAPTDATAKPAVAKDATEKPDANDEAAWRAKFVAARRTLADDSKELDVVQREYGLKQTQFYSDPNVALREQTSRKDLDDTLQEVNAKKQDVDNDKQAISKLEDELRKAGGDPGWANTSESQAGEPQAKDESQAAVESPANDAEPKAPAPQSEPQAQPQQQPQQ